MYRYLLSIAMLLLVSCNTTTDSAPPPATEQTLVTRVVDGDTVTVLVDGNMEYVRIIGIDAPETKECFAQEATDELRDLVEGKHVLLERKTDEDRDNYDRLLRYLSVDGIDVGAQMLFEGFAKNYPWFPHPRSEAYGAIAQEAENKELGLWGECN